VIVTSGGVGPTHDDVTIKSVAVALNQELVLHEEMAKLLQEKMNQGGSGAVSTAGQAQPQPTTMKKTSELTDAQRKMATLPARSKLKYLSNNPSDWPVLQCSNVFVLPGVPEFFATKIGLVADYVSSDELERSTVYKVVLSVDETAIVSILNAAVIEHPEVSFGSYPFVSHREFKTVLTLEGRLKSCVDEGGEMNQQRKSFSKDQMDHHVRLALDYLLTYLPEGSILRVENDDGLL
jgi:FAD synthetase